MADFIILIHIYSLEAIFFFVAADVLSGDKSSSVKKLLQQVPVYTYVQKYVQSLIVETFVSVYCVYWLFVCVLNFSLLTFDLSVSDN